MEDDEENNASSKNEKMAMAKAAAQIIGRTEIFLGLLRAFCVLEGEDITGVRSVPLVCRERSIVDAKFW